jgi:hypothetical protein
LHAWVYKIETGQVFSYNPEAGQFLPLAERATGLPSMRRVLTNIDQLPAEGALPAAAPIVQSAAAAAPSAE